jgi:hypothetical protein
VNYRVVLQRDGDEFEIGSIGIRHGATWAWDIDAVGSSYTSWARKGQPGGSHALEGGFARPIGTDNAVHLSRPYRKRDAGYC